MAVAAQVESCDPQIAEVLGRIPTWWERRAAEVGLAPEWRDWNRALGRPPVALEPTPRLLDESPYEIGEAYITALEPVVRLRHGRHYTPAPLAAELWAEVLEVAEPSGPVVDPAAGAGALLIPPLRDFVKASRDPEDSLRKVSARFSGTDVDPIAIWLGNALLGAELLPLWQRLPPERRKPLPRLLRVGDGLGDPGDRPGAILMNPPYGRVRLSPSARARWHETLFGHANRYALFIQAAVERVSPEGVVGAIVPTSFLGGAYFQKLRAYLAREAPLLRLAFVQSRAGVFVGDVLQETCLAVFHKGARWRSTRCSRVTLSGPGRRVELPDVSVGGSRPDLPWFVPREPRDGALISNAARLEARLSDYGWKASTGPLVWNRHKPQIRAARSEGAVPVLWAADLDGGKVRRASGRDKQRWISLRPEDEFMRLTEPVILAQRTTAPEQPRRLVVAILDADTLSEWGGVVVVENHVNVLRCSSTHSPLTPALLHRILDTTTLDRLYRCLTGSVAVSAYELDALPMPSPSVLRSWPCLSPSELERAVAAHYGDDPS